MSFLIPDTTPDERLSGLEKFMEFWLGPRLPDFGEPVENLKNIELPDPLRRFLAFAGKWPPAYRPDYLNRFCSNDCLLPVSPAKSGYIHRIGGSRLLFAVECQAVWFAATSPTGTDPPVWLSDDLFKAASIANTDWRTGEVIPATWELTCNSLSHFLVSFILQDFLMGAQESAAHENALSIFEHAGCDIQPVWINAEYTMLRFWPHARLSTYLIDGRILLRKGTGDGTTTMQEYAFEDPACVELLERLGLTLPN